MKKVIKTLKFKILLAVVGILMFGICIETVIFIGKEAAAKVRDVAIMRQF